MFNIIRKNTSSILLFDFIADFCDICLEYGLRYDRLQSDEKKPKKTVETSPKKYDGIGPTTKEGVPIVLRSVSIFANQLVVFRLTSVEYTYLTIRKTSCGKMCINRSVIFFIIFFFSGNQRTQSTKMVQANVRIFAQVSVRW